MLEKSVHLNLFRNFRCTNGIQLEGKNDIIIYAKKDSNMHVCM